MQIYSRERGRQVGARMADKRDGAGVSVAVKAMIAPVTLVPLVKVQGS